MIVKCPHCFLFVEIIELNCKIFRHGVYKDTVQQMDPHTPKDICDKVVNLIYGCGKPFKINDSGIAEICDYI